MPTAGGQAHRLKFAATRHLVTAASRRSKPLLQSGPLPNGGRLACVGASAGNDLVQAARFVDGEFVETIAGKPPSRLVPAPDLRLLELTQLKDYSGASDSYLR